MGDMKTMTCFLQLTLRVKGADQVAPENNFTDQEATISRQELAALPD